MLVENREAVMLLAPFVEGSYDVTVGIKTNMDRQKYYHCSIIRVFPKQSAQNWQANGIGGTLLEAARDALSNAKLFTDRWGI